MMVIASLFAWTAAAEDPLDDLPAAPNAVGTVTDEKDPRWGQSRVGPIVARIIEPDELRGYALVLHLSQEQRSAVRDAYLTYRQRTDRLNEEYHEPIAALAFPAADFNAHQYGKEFVRLITELRAVEAKYQRELVAHDRAFLGALELILAEPQKPSFERVALRRSRKRCQPHLASITPGHIDLVDLVDKYITDADVLGDLDPLLLEYERLITPLYLSIDASKRTHEGAEARDLAALKYADDGETPLEPGSPEAVARGEAFTRNRQARLAETIPEQERLADINDQFIERLKLVIPAEQAPPLLHEYTRMSFPYIHPDPCDPLAIMQSLLEAEGFDPDLRGLMQIRFDAWRKEYDAMTRDMQRHYKEYSRAFARTFSAEREHTAAIRKLRFDRWAASEKALKSLHAMLPADLAAAFDKRIAAFESRLAGERERETNPRRANP